jgi:hypothetical protein
MVLSFTNWNDWTTDAGTSGSIDWDHIETQPRTLVYEALRQAVMERLTALAGSPQAALDKVITTGPSAYPQFFPLLLDPVQIGVDMDQPRRLFALHHLVALLMRNTSASGVVRPSFEDPADPYASGLTLAAALALIGDSARIADFYSAAWARQTRAILNQMRLVKTILKASDRGLYRNVFANYTSYNVQAGARLVESISATANSYPNLETAMQAAEWAEFTGQYPTDLLFLPEGLATGRAVGSGSNWAAERYATTWTLDASLLARSCELYGSASNDWPGGEYAPGAGVFASVPATTGIISIPVGRSKAIAQNKIWSISGFSVENYAVPGGFTFQE